MERNTFIGKQQLHQCSRLRPKDCKDAKATRKAACSSSRRRPWDELPEDLLIIIARSLGPNPVGFVRFGSVCRSWHNAAPKENYPYAGRMPLLMLAEDGPKNKYRRFYSPSEDKIYRLLLPETRDRRVCTSIGGWVVTTGANLEIHVLNPFSRDRIRLPSILAFHTVSEREAREDAEYMRNLFLGKICFSKSPGKQDQSQAGANKLTALAFYSHQRRLAFAREGDARWTNVDSKLWPFNDAVFHKGHFYAVSIQPDFHGHNPHVAVVAVDLRRRRTKKIASIPHAFNWNTYIVESSGDLLVVVRSKWPIENQPALTFEFRIYRIVNLEKGEWVPVASLGDRSLFLGQNNSFSVRAQELFGCEEDRIYFTDEDHEGHDLGVYDVQGRGVKPHFRGKSLSRFSPPLWVNAP